MIQEPFAAGNSQIHALDPRLRILSAIAYSLTIALLSQFPAMVASLAFSILLVIMARLSPGKVLKRLLTVFWFLLLIWAVLPITFEGPPLHHLGPFVITQPGVILSGQITLKSISILLVFMALIATMPISVLGKALAGLKLPGKIIHLLLMTYRYIFVIEREYKKLYTAIKIRGFKPGTNLHSYKTYAYLIGMLFVRASTRAERVHQAMILRGFQGRFYTLETYASSGKNRLFTLFIITVILFTILLEYEFVWKITI